ncbi:hypothetical protein SLEP1_g24665 [Rubroshorea leprosula]|uniref:DNA2/NAM7 helicase-like C-terminal domain-containing protein n=1 Tax=Rubroshorea leprosula TaxID=152421 RepID=A0AAV5JML4_9ROSI|nr:hypothetical protein SLEP1_g24665 [Rubroshorea leprosula]
MYLMMQLVCYCVNNFGASSCKLENTSFDFVIIREAAVTSNCILDGSTKEPSLNARQNFYGDVIMPMLPVKHSMHELILNWSSKAIYRGKIKGHASFATHILSSLENVKTMTLCLLQPQSSFGSSRCIMEEKKDEEDRTLNEGEGVKQRLLFHMQIDLLTQGGVQASNIGIITACVMLVLLLTMLRSNEDWPEDTSTVNVASSWSTTPLDTTKCKMDTSYYSRSGRLV